MLLGLGLTRVQMIAGFALAFPLPLTCRRGAGKPGSRTIPVIMKCTCLDGIGERLLGPLLEFLGLSGHEGAAGGVGNERGGEESGFLWGGGVVGESVG